MTICANCLQPIHQDAPRDVSGPTQTHRFATDCVRAVLARCIEIAVNGAILEQTGIGIANEIDQAFAGRV